jgi:hypothetical protein
MNRVFGNVNTPLLECINENLMKYRIRWDFKEETDGEKTVVSFFETDLYVKYNLRFFDIKNAILDAINKDTDYKIISGF